ncbi:tumor necrosis factor receptor superfamily member 17 isoform X1 [Lagenorhynchus albirostris]|uniref:tumor necrosis factor receptor superfamily member 17 isoform X1 n=1 Tax=Lagenorhynchus albirostris TaxID=27610 RepID=UPI0028E8122F|nr:tumor necrosis factor receptor superfamily member 17 isoform X1 [Lagenorhynchus albirostris]
MQREEAEVWSKLGCPTCHRVGAGVRASPGAIRRGAADRESLSSRGWPAPSCSTQDAGKRTAVLRRPALLLTQSHKKKKTQCVRNKVPKVTSDSRFALPNLLLRKCQHKQLTQMVNHTVLLQPLSSDTILQEESPGGHWVITLIVKGTNAILWTCLGLSLIVSLTVFVLMFLLRKMSSEPLKDEFKNTGPALQKDANADLYESDDGGTGAETLLSRGLGYTVEECTCEDCVRSKPKVDSDHFFPLPAMEEGATILVTTKTNDYCNSLLAASSVTGMEKSVFPAN